MSRARDGAHDPVGGHTARQGAHVTVFEGPLGPQGDLNRLFAVGGHGRAVRAVYGDMDDAEPDLGLGPSPAASNTGTFGDPEELRTARTLVYCGRAGAVLAIGCRCLTGKILWPLDSQGER